MSLSGKKGKIIIALILLSFSLTGYFYYKRYTSVNNVAKRMGRENIADYFYRHVFMSYDNPVNNDKDRIDSLIEKRKEVNNLDNSWKFTYETWDLHHIDYSRYLIDYTYIFEQKTNDIQRIFSETYYYDLDRITPRLILRKVTSYNGEEYKTLEEESFCERW